MKFKLPAVGPVAICFINPANSPLNPKHEQIQDLYMRATSNTAEYSKSTSLLLVSIANAHVAVNHVLIARPILYTHVLMVIHTRS